MSTTNIALDVSEPLLKLKIGLNLTKIKEKTSCMTSKIEEITMTINNETTLYGYTVPFTRILIEQSDNKVVYDTHINGICEAVKMYPDVTSIHHFTPSDTVYAVYAIWSTGDSYHEYINADYAVYGLFNNKAIAEELLAHLENYESPMLWPESSHTFTTSDGQTIYLPHLLEWHGYFDILSTLEIAELTYC